MFAVVVADAVVEEAQRQRKLEELQVSNGRSRRNSGHSQNSFMSSKTPLRATIMISFVRSLEIPIKEEF